MDHYIHAGCNLPSSFREVSDQGEDAVGELLQIGVDLFQRAGRLEDVEVAVEGDLVADPYLFVIDPGVRDMRQDFSLEVNLHVLIQRDVLDIAQIGIRYGFPFFFLAFGSENDPAFFVALGTLDGDDDSGPDRPVPGRKNRTYPPLA